MTRTHKKPARMTGKTAKLKEFVALGGVVYEGSYMPEPVIDREIARLKAGITTAPVEPEKIETLEEVDERLKERFSILNQLTQLCINGDIRSMIVFGPPGLGKTYDIEHALRSYDPKKRTHSIVRGHSTAVGILKELWDARHEGSILVLDDCDGVWDDETALGLIKIATDTSDIREISYLSEGTVMSNKDNSVVAKQFVFEGTLIFITNKDLDAYAAAGARYSEHMGAIMSRGHYVDLTMRDRRDSMVRIEQVAKSDGFMKDLTKEEKVEVLNFVREHKDTLRNLDLRMAIKIGDLKKKVPKNWKNFAKATCFRSKH